MTRRRILADLSLCLFLSSPLSSAQVTPLSCAIGFGRGSRVIPDAHINDGYCDCPLDAADEPLTDACSGSAVGGWSGVAGTADRSPTFSCPQQPKKQLPLSRLNDGVCDCCDGADEKLASSQTDCPDICQQVLAEERALRAKLEQSFAEGYAKRQEELAKYSKLVEKARLEMKQIEKEQMEKQEKLDEFTTALQFMQWESANQRLSTVQDIVASEELVALFEPLSNDELMTFLVHACQVSGELAIDSEDDATTCVPLRLAGIDIGIMWGEEDFTTSSASLENLVLSKGRTELLARILDHNARPLEVPVWSEAGLPDMNTGSTTTGHRRLDDYYYDEAYEGMYDDDMMNDELEEDYEAPASRHRPEFNNRPTALSSEDQAKMDELLGDVLDTPFSTWRARFLERSEEIERLLKESEKSDRGEEEGTEEDEDTDAEEKSTEGTRPMVDPMAIPMIRSTLSRRKNRIQRGLEYAVSAKLLLKGMEDNEDLDEVRQHLRGLASMTLYHGKIGSGEVWKILRASIPDFRAIEFKDEESCGSPWSAMCPPQGVNRHGVLFPPPTILRAAEALCEQAAGEEAAKLCASVDDEEIPSEIPDGYYGYYVTQPQEKADPLLEMFSSLDKLRSNRSGVSEAERKIQEIETSLKSLEGKLKGLEDDTGGEDGAKYGPNGELFALRDDCFEVEAGKYIYEVCLFGKAAQKEKRGHSSTGLGSWTGMEVDEETGERILKWENGLKCWNGPSRSATVYVACGADTKVVSAEEPDTCRYVLEMESHIACDDDLKKRLGL